MARLKKIISASSLSFESILTEQFKQLIVDRIWQKNCLVFESCHYHKCTGSIANKSLKQTDGDAFEDCPLGSLIYGCGNSMDNKAVAFCTLHKFLFFFKVKEAKGTSKLFYVDSAIPACCCCMSL